MNFNIGFIGAGVMAEAFMQGLLNTKSTLPEKILAYDIKKERLDYLTGEYGIQALDDCRELIRESQVILLAVKPQNVAEALAPFKEVFTEDKLVISIAAGVSINKLYKYISEMVSLARVMPNTPCLIGKGASAVSFSKNIKNEQKETACKILEAVGTVHVLPEKLMNAVTGLSGSGPAYIYLVIEALSDAGVYAGLPRDISLNLAVQTVIGAASMVEVTKTNPALLKEKVTSPAGTTISGLHILERAGVRAAFMDAVIAAAKRSEELGLD